MSPADLSQFSDLDLAAELDRRAAASVVNVLFYGVWPGTRAGHYIRDKHGDSVWKEYRRSLYPWDSRESQRPEDEGIFWHWHSPTGPLTMLVSWDRSEDQRGGCCASFVISATVTPEHGLKLAREAFPKVFDRIETHLGRTVVLGGQP